MIPRFPLLVIPLLLGSLRAQEAEILGVDPASLSPAQRRNLPGYRSAPRRVPRRSPRAEKRKIVINIPSRRLRFYEGEKLLGDIPMAIGKLRYPGARGNTRTRIGSYRITSWHKDYRSRDYPIRWSWDPWRGAFGKYTAKLGPRASYQYIHGTVGPEDLGDWLVRKLPVPELEEGDTPGAQAKRLRLAEEGLSHGCVRVSNRNIEMLHRETPVGTRVEKIYCLVERILQPDGTHAEVTLPNVYSYRDIADSAVFYPDTGRTENYHHPKDAVGPR